MGYFCKQNVSPITIKIAQSGHTGFNFVVNRFAFVPRSKRRKAVRWRRWRRRRRRRRPDGVIWLIAKNTFPPKNVDFWPWKYVLNFFIDNRFTEDMFDASLPSSIQTVLWQSTKPWSSLVEGDEGCRGPSGKLLCLRQSQ